MGYVLPLQPSGFPGAHPAGTARSCWEEPCGDPPVVLARVQGRDRGRPLCDRHAHAQVLDAERHGYDLTLTALPGRW
jgi:hypothetical protein